MDFNWAQAKAYAQVTKHLERGQHRLTVDMPTGSGKGFLAGRLLQDYWGQGRTPRALVMTYSRDLRADLNDAFSDPEKTPGLVGLTSEYVARDGVPRRPIVIATYHSGMKALREGSIHPDQLDCIILDEGHLALAPERQKILRELKVPQIALTATSAYARDKNLELAGYKTVYSLPLGAAVEGGLLAPFQSMVHVLEGAYPALRHVRISHRGDYEAASLEQALNVHAFNEAVADLLCGWRQPGHGRRLTDRKSVLFCAGIGHAEAMAKILTAQMGRDFIRAIHSDMPDTERAALLRAHRAGDIRWLSTANYLIHGHDDPGLDGVINIAPTRSPVVAGQRPGRMMRLDPFRPFKESLCFELLYGTESNQILHGELMGGFSFMGPRGIYAVRPPDTLDSLASAPHATGRTIFLASELKALTKQREQMRLRAAPAPVLTQAFAEAVAQDGRPFDTLVTKALQVLAKLSPNLLAPEFFLLQAASGKTLPVDRMGLHTNPAYAWAIALTRSVDELFPQPEREPEAGRNREAGQSYDAGYLDRLGGGATDDNPVERAAMLAQSYNRLVRYEGHVWSGAPAATITGQKTRRDAFLQYLDPDTTMENIAETLGYVSGSYAAQLVSNHAKLLKERCWPEIEQLRSVVGDTEGFRCAPKYTPNEKKFGY